MAKRAVAGEIPGGSHFYTQEVFCMADETRTKTRIYELSEATTLTSDMNLVVDTETGGTKRVQLSTLIDNDLDTAGKAADSKATGDALDGKVDKEAGKGIVAIDNTLTQTGQAADAKKTGDEITSVKADITKVYSDVEGSYPIYLTYEQGSYLTNGFADSPIRIRAQINAGTYIFNPSSNIYFSIFYYDTDSSGTQFVGMGGIVDTKKVTVARTAYITIQYRNSGVITAAAASELGVSVYVGYPLDEQLVSTTNRMSENSNKANSKDYELIVGRTAYYVGKDKTYTTINAALNAWANDNYPQATIYISNGEYNEVVAVENSKDINLIGESKDGTIIRTTHGQYVDAPIYIKHGNVMIANLTIIADHTGDANFSYEADANPSCAYGVHIDGGTIAGKVVVRNCRIISDQSPAFGLGTIPNSIIRIEDCEAYCFTAGTALTSTKQYRCLAYGCLLCHMSSPANYPTRETETLQLVNNKLFAKNTKNVITLNYGTDTTEHMNVLAINNVLSSDAESDKNLLFVPDTGLVQLDSNSQGNSCNSMNYTQ